MEFDDKRKSLLEAISLEKSRVDLSSPIVFLCGGLVDNTMAESSSVRAAFLSHIFRDDHSLASQVRLAEDFKDWIHDGVYNDLLDFENDIAQISSVIVIVLESPGALAELGLFVRNNVLNKKLVVFVSNEHYEAESFISLGPLRYLCSLNNQAVYAYPWDLSKIDESLKDSLPEMKEDLLSVISEMDKSELFDYNNDGHISFVLYEFIRIYQALKLSEIELYAKEVGLDIKRDRIKRLLFLLMKFEFIGKSRRGHVDYFYPLRDEVKINFGGQFDEKKAKVSSSQFYHLSGREKRRSSFLKGLPSIEDRRAE